MSGVLNVDTIADNAGTGPVTLTKQDTAKQRSTYSTDTVIKTSINTSSITDQGTGSFDSNYTNNMSTANETFTAVVWGTSGVAFAIARTAGTNFHRVNTHNSAGTIVDRPQTTSVIGDLA